MLDSANPFPDLFRSPPIVIVRVSLDAGRQYAGVERAADHDSDILFLAQRQKARERFLFEKGVAARQQEDVKVPGAGQFLGDIPFVDPRSNRLDRSGSAQVVERAIAAVHEFLDPRVGSLSAPVGEDVDVVAEHDVHMIETEALKREFEGTHHAVVGIIEPLPP